MILRRKKTIKVLLLISMSITLMTGCSLKNDIVQKLNVNGVPVSGLYGDKDGKNKNIFYSINDESNIKNVKCKLKDGELNGKCYVTYADGSVQSGNMKDGNWDGKTIVEELDGTTHKIYYSKGVAVGRTVTTYANGQEQQNWYYQDRLLSDWIDTAVETDYREYYNDTYSLIDKCVLVSGKVEKIFQDDNQCIIKIIDQLNNKYYIAYNNGIYKRKSIVIMPHIEVGDDIKIYGFFKELIQNEFVNDEEEDYGFTFPQISALYGEVLGKDYDIYHVPENAYYENILENPYCYVGSEVNISAIVKNIYCDEKDYYCEINSDNNIYYVKIDLEKYVENDLPVPGDSINIKGTLYGNYCKIEKNQGRNEAVTYPLINDPKIEIL